MLTLDFSWVQHVFISPWKGELSAVLHHNHLGKRSPEDPPKELTIEIKNTAVDLHAVK